MNGSNDNIRVIIPLTVRRRNGRPKILPPECVLEGTSRAQSPQILKAIGRAWSWRRRLESGEASTATELAKLEGITERFLSRTVRLAYLSPSILDRLVLAREATSLTIPTLIAKTIQPWSMQPDNTFE